MKQFIIGAMLFSGLQVSAQNDPVRSIADTMVFDLLNAEISTQMGVTYYELPLVAKIGGGINSFDLWFQFNQSKLTYDSTITVVPDLDAFSFYNTGSQTLSNTTSGPSISYEVPANTPLLKLRFVLASAATTIDTNDFTSLNVLFNGEVSSHTFNYSAEAGLKGEQDDQIQLFPNPVSDLLTIRSALNTTVSVYEVEGKMVRHSLACKAGQDLQIPVNDLPEGSYFVKLESAQSAIVRKIEIVRIH